MRSGTHSLVCLVILTAFPGLQGRPDALFAESVFFSAESAVSGTGGADTRLVQFMATPGEKVTVQTIQQQAEEDKAQRGDFFKFDLNVSTGVASTVRSEMLKLMPIMESKIIGSIAEMKKKGGKRGRSV